MKTAEYRWSRQMWCWGFLFLFLSHAFAVFWFADRRNGSAWSWQKPVPFLYLSGAPDTDQRLLQSAALRDPTLFALPHAGGFSGGAWLKFQPQLPRLSNWSAPMEWLTRPLEQLGTSLDDYVASNRPSEEQLLASLRTVSTPELRVPDEPIITRSTATIEGPLAARKLLAAPTLPPIAHHDVIGKTVVVVSVNGEGVVESAAMTRESGSKLADERAVQLARAFAFELLPIREARRRETAPPVIGRIVFAWHVVTNGAPTTASTP